jgi:hypothetical protein
MAFVSCRSNRPHAFSAFLELDLTGAAPMHRAISQYTHMTAVRPLRIIDTGSNYRRAPQAVLA